MIKKINKNKWLNKPARYSKNTLTIDGYQVMQRWEYPYMADLAKIVSTNGGSVLEIGFGMGISAGYIQKDKKVAKHTIIECHPQVAARALKEFRKQIKDGKLIIINFVFDLINLSSS